MSFEVDSSVFAMRMQQLKTYVGKDMAAQCLPLEAKQLITGVLRVTPPFGKGGRKAAGNRAVKRDITATMRPMTYKIFTQSDRLRNTMKSLEQKQDYAAIEATLKALKSGIIGSPTVGRFDPQNHKRWRNRRGHVSNRVQPVVLFGRDQANALKKYIKEVQSRVGWTLSGWRAAALATGVTMPPFATQPAPSGYIKMLEGTSPSITITNGANKSPALKDQVRYVMKGRERALASKVARLIAGKATNLGFTTIAGTK